jgi:glucose-1-phosphate thymidylyltransferase
MVTLTSKAVILARGLGTRMRRKDRGADLDRQQAMVAAAGLKAMMPLGGRPFLDYVVSALADAGYLDICLVIGPDREVVRDHFERDTKPRRVRISYAIQDKPLGTADAVLSAEKFAGGDRFLVINSDNFYPVEAYSALRPMEGAGIAAFWRKALVTQGNLSAERVAMFPIVETDAQGYATRLVEPNEAAQGPDADALISMNCWMFTPTIFRACRQIAPSASGELEIQAAVSHAMAALGERFRVMPFSAPVLDLTSRADVAYVTERLSGTRVML